MTTREEITVGSSEQIPSTYPKGKTYSFFIAIDEYQNGIRPLNNAVRDAEAIISCLINQYDFDSSNIVFLKNEQVTKKEIIDQFDRYTELITGEDNLLFYFSGHGYFHNNNKKGYWLTFDSISRTKSSYLGNDEIISYIKNIDARHIFGIVDACFSDALFNTRNHRAQQSQRYNLPSRWLLTAGRLEPVLDGPIGKHSPFAETLLNYLNYHKGPYIWVSELCTKVVDLVEFNAQKQLPRGEPLSNVGHGGGEFLFLRKGERLPAPEGSISNTRKSSSPKLLETKNPKANSKAVDELKNSLADQLTDNEWKSVFRQLNDALKKGKKKVLLMQMIATYNQILEERISGVISQNQINRYLNALRMEVFTFIDYLDADDLI